MSDKIKISRRLWTVATYIEDNSYLVDVGSDHAYLPIYCVQSGKSKKAIAGEVVEGPFQSARKKVLETSLDQIIDVRLGNGLEVVLGEPVTHISIAGMGGALIASILEKGIHRVPTAKRLILQPNVASDHVRLWAYQNNWRLLHEEVLEEDGKIYEILVLERGADNILYEENKAQKLRFGPFLLERKEKPFIKKWQRELNQLVKVEESLLKAPSTQENHRRLIEIKEKIKQIKEVL